MNDNHAVTDQETLHLLRSLMRVGRMTELRLDSLLSDVDLSTTRFITLQRINRADEPTSLSQLASCLGFVKSNATQLIDNLEKAELVRRVQSANDRRCTLLELTEAGQKRYEAGLQVIQSVSETLNQIYTPEEQAQLSMLLQRLNATLG